MNKICEHCTLPATKSAVISGKYYGRLCVVHYNLLIRAHSPSTGHAEYNRQRDFEDHQSDVVQPYDKDGHPHPDFIHLYPDKAREMWGEDTVRKFS